LHQYQVSVVLAIDPPELKDAFLIPRRSIYTGC
jgi:hypothetical protein